MKPIQAPTSLLMSWSWFIILKNERPEKLTSSSFDFSQLKIINIYYAFMLHANTVLNFLIFLLPTKVLAIRMKIPHAPVSLPRHSVFPPLSSLLLDELSSKANSFTHALDSIPFLSPLAVAPSFLSLFSIISSTRS